MKATVPPYQINPLCPWMILGTCLHTSRETLYYKSSSSGCLTPSLVLPMVDEYGLPCTVVMSVLFAFYTLPGSNRLASIHSSYNAQNLSTLALKPLVRATDVAATVTDCHLVTFFLTVPPLNLGSPTSVHIHTDQVLIVKCRLRCLHDDDGILLTRLWLFRF